jgi:CheY-like chemotaxis protein
MARADILVIDDDPVVTRMLTRVLAGHNVVVTHSGESALELMKARAFDLILCDLSMPGMSGIDFYRAAAAISPELSKHVIFMTGGAFTAESYEFLTRLPNSWLEKPFDIGALRELIRARSVAV